MKNTGVLKGSLVISALVSLLIAMPALASTKKDVKALQEDVGALKEGQQQMQKDMEEIKNLLKQGAARAPAARPAAAPFKPKDLEVGQSPVLGSADAAVTIFAYSDYQCPFCSRHATQVLPQMVKEYVDAGKLRIVMREYPIESIHPRAFAASQAALCAGEQGKYWGMHDKIFANQRSLTDEDFASHVKLLELDSTAFNGCIAGEEISEQIQAEIKEAYDLGISGTPSFVAGLTNPEDANKVHVTEYIRGAQPFARFQGIIDGLLDEPAETE